jgi:hypothetical protein
MAPLFSTPLAPPHQRLAVEAETEFLSLTHFENSLRV